MFVECVQCRHLCTKERIRSRQRLPGKCRIKSYRMSRNLQSWTEKWALEGTGSIHTVSKEEEIGKGYIYPGMNRMQRAIFPLWEIKGNPLNCQFPLIQNVSQGARALLRVSHVLPVTDSLVIELCCSCAELPTAGPYVPSPGLSGLGQKFLRPQWPSPEKCWAEHGAAGLPQIPAARLPLHHKRSFHGEQRLLLPSPQAP